MSDEAVETPDENGFAFDGLVVLHPDGILYENQAGGVACLHPTARGVFIPRRVSEYVKRALLDCYDSSLTDAEVADIQPYVEWPVIANGSFEAWLRVQIAPNVEGVLVWANSD